MVKGKVHQQKDNFLCLFVAQLRLSIPKFRLLFIVAAIEQLFGAYIFAIGAAAIFGRENTVPHTARRKQGRTKKKGECKTKRFHGNGFNGRTVNIASNCLICNIHLAEPFGVAHIIVRNAVDLPFHFFG